MATILVSMVGLGVIAVGVVWAILQWSQKPDGQKIINAIDAVTPGDLAKYVQMMAESAQATPGRVEPLQQADSLMSYFEKTENKAGQDAIAAVVAAIFAQREAK